MIATALSLVLLFVSGRPQQSGPLATALAELNKGNVFDSVRLLKEIVRTEPSSSSAYYYLSTVYTRIGRYDTAFRYLQTGITHNPEQGAFYHQLGVIRRHEGCRPEAMAAFQQALRMGMGRDEAAVWRHIGELYEDLLAREQAVEAYSNAIRLAPDDAEAHLALGKLYLDRNEPERALVELRAALKTSPGLNGVYAALGRAYRALGDLPSALSVLRQGVDRDGSDQEARYVLSQVLLESGRSADGRNEIDAYRRLQERMSQTNTLFEAAVQQAQAGEFKHAEELLNETLGLAPRYAPALHVLGVVLLNRGNSQRASEVLQEASAANPLNAETYFNLGTAYFRSGKLPEALDAANRALVLEEEDPRYTSLLGDIYSKMTRAAQATTARERSARLRARPNYRPRDPYSSEMRPRDDAATLKEICGNV